MGSLRSLASRTAWRSGLRRPPRLRRRRYRHVVVVTYGRSGSTLVQGLLNGLPRTLVRGENNLYVLHLFRALAAVEQFRRLHLKHDPRSSSSAFYGLHEARPGAFVASTRDLLRRNLLGGVPPSEVDVLGFKEVLWHRVKVQEQEAFFDFLDKVLPGCLYVLNERDVDAVVDSGFWQARDRTEALVAVERVQELQQFLRDTRPGRTLDVRYELLTSPDQATSDAVIRSIAEFVHGSCDEQLLARLRQTRRTGHGPFPFGSSRGRRDKQVPG